MKTASINEIKKELWTLAHPEMIDLCLRLAKYKKDNKEMLSYLLFEAQQEQVFIENIKAEIDRQFDEITRNNLYLVYKSLRKILRNTNKFIKYSGIIQTEVELLIYYCAKMKKSGIRIHNSTSLSNLYEQQIKKIGKSLSKLHEDLQFDYQQELEKLY